MSAGSAFPWMAATSRPTDWSAAESSKRLRAEVISEYQTHQIQTHDREHEQQDDAQEIGCQKRDHSLEGFHHRHVLGQAVDHEDVQPDWRGKQGKLQPPHHEKAQPKSFLRVVPPPKNKTQDGREKYTEGEDDGGP